MRIATLIVAAGTGTRFNSKIPKQYQSLAGIPIVKHSIKTFLEYSNVYVVIHPDHHEYYQSSIHDLNLPKPIIGGNTRQESVLLGLEHLKDQDYDYVLIHDAARPFIKHDLIQRIITSLVHQKAVIPAMPVVDTIKRIDLESSNVDSTVDRSVLKAVQTPQAFSFDIILHAHQSVKDQSITLTDDAAVAEFIGIDVHTIDGDVDNFKITTFDDLKRAEYLMNMKQETRIGLGFDVHAFEDGDHVILGGLSIPHDKKLKGHSDADVVLHALTDALLGSIAAGDIGTHFPPSEEEWKDADSTIFLEHAVQLIESQNGQIINVDITIICEAPKIGPYRPKMQSCIASLLKIEQNRISIKATTTEGLGFTGRREGIACQVIASVRV